MKHLYAINFKSVSQFFIQSLKHRLYSSNNLNSYLSRTFGIQSRKGSCVVGNKNNSPEFAMKRSELTEMGLVTSAPELIIL